MAVRTQPARSARGRIFAALAASALLITGCAAESPAEPSSTVSSTATSGATSAMAPTGQTVTSTGETETTSPAGNSLEGKTYEVTKVNMPGKLDRGPVTLTFNDGQLAGYAGCNRMFGEVSITDDSFVAGPMAQTQMACDQELMDQDSWLIAFLAKPVSYQLDGRELTLTAGDLVINLTEQQPAEAMPLEGTMWNLTTLLSGESASSVPNGVAATLHIVEGRAQVVTGCNRGSGPAVIESGHLAVTPLGLTKMMCEPDANLVEQAFTAVISADPAAEYTIVGDQLTVTTGDRGLVFTGTDSANGEASTTPSTATAESAAPATLSGPTWTLTQITVGDTTTAVPADVDAHMVITDGRINGKSGCNGFAGEATIDAGKQELTVDMLSTTLMACAGDRGLVETAMFEVLVEPHSNSSKLAYQIQGTTLTLTNSAGSLVFSSERPVESASNGTDRSIDPPAPR